MTFYTYMWLREDGTPYYVGKGQGRRGFTSVSHTVKRPKDDARIFVQLWESEQRAFEVEKFYIRLFGRKDNGTGILRNLTDGGDCGPNQTGFKKSLEERYRQSKRLIGNHYALGRKASDDERRQRSEQRKGKRRLNKDGTPWHMPASANELLSQKKIGIHASPATEFKVGVKHGTACAHCTMIRESMSVRPRDSRGHFIKEVNL